MFLFFIAAACVGNAQNLPLHADFAVGMGREKVMSQFGEPVQVTRFHKKNDSVWGPIETYWATIPMGSTVVVWSYESRNETTKGRTELYFLNGADEVSAIGFSPDGAVYEANGTPPVTRPDHPH